MRTETILNHVYWIKSFVYTNVKLHNTGRHKWIVVDIESRKNSQPECSVCGKPGSVYDHMPHQRQFEFIPLWNIPVYFHYVMHRVDCRECGVRVERVPWAEGNPPVTKPFALFLARWARKLSWKEVAESFCTTWDTVFQSVKQIVEYGLKHRELDGVTAIGVDEIQYGKDHQYLTLVYQINEGIRRLLFVGQKRTAKTLPRFFRDFGKERCAQLEFVCSDMWKAYIKVIKKKAPNALHINESRYEKILRFS